MLRLLGIIGYCWAVHEVQPWWSEMTQPKMTGITRTIRTTVLVLDEISGQNLQTSKAVFVVSTGLIQGFLDPSEHLHCKQRAGTVHTALHCISNKCQQKSVNSNRLDARHKTTGSENDNEL